MQIQTLNHLDLAKLLNDPHPDKINFVKQYLILLHQIFEENNEEKIPELIKLNKISKTFFNN